MYMYIFIYLYIYMCTSGNPEAASIYLGAQGTFKLDPYFAG